jgi:branched-chain amino acid aminotransferase
MECDFTNGEWQNQSSNLIHHFCWIHQLGFHYGQAIFEGMKAYKDQDAVWLFRPDENYKRFNNSGKNGNARSSEDVLWRTKSIAKAR